MISLHYDVRWYNEYEDHWIVAGCDENGIIDLFVLERLNKRRRGRISFDFYDEAIMWARRWVRNLMDTENETWISSRCFLL